LDPIGGRRRRSGSKKRGGVLKKKKKEWGLKRTNFEGRELKKSDGRGGGEKEGVSLRRAKGGVQNRERWE